MRIYKKSLSIVSLFIVMSFVFSGVQAQGMRNAKKDCPKGIEFNEKQKEQVREIRIAFAKATKDVKNELNELKARQKTLMTAEEPNLNEIYANIDKMSDLKNLLKKDHLAMKLDMQSVMTDEQKILMANRQACVKGFAKGKGKMGKASVMRYGKGTRGQKMGAGKGQRQKGMGEKSHKWKMLDLTDDQKNKMKEIRMAHRSATQELRNKAEVLRLKQKHLMTADKPDKKEIMQNADRLSEIQNAMAKKRVAHHLEMRKILTKDQLVLFLNRPGFGKRTP